MATWAAIVEADATLRAWLAEYDAHWQACGDDWHRDPHLGAWFDLCNDVAWAAMRWIDTHRTEQHTMPFDVIARIEAAWLVG